MTDLQEANQVIVRLASCTIAIAQATLHHFFDSGLSVVEASKKHGIDATALIHYINESAVMLTTFLAIDFPEPDDPILVSCLDGANFLRNLIGPIYTQVIGCEMP